MNGCIEMARCGESRAVGMVVAALRPRMVRMAAYYARCSGEDPEDLLQEAWVGLLEALPQLDPKIGRPDQYLLQRARWRLLDAIRRARIRRCDLLHEDIPAPTASCEIEATVAELCVGTFLGRLSTTQRTVIGCLLTGLTWRETGQAMGCSSANIAYHVRQIRCRYEAWRIEEGIGCTVSPLRGIGV